MSWDVWACCVGLSNWCSPASSPTPGLACWVDAGQLVDGVATLAALLTRRISWRGVDYAVSMRPSRVRILRDHWRTLAVRMAPFRPSGTPDTSRLLFRCLWSGQLISNLGTQSSLYGIGLWLFAQSGRLLDFGLVALVVQLARILVLPLLARRLNHWPPARVMLLAHMPPVRSAPWLSAGCCLLPPRGKTNHRLCCWWC